MYDKILFPVDLANLDTQEQAWITALEFARNHDSELHVLTVVPFLPGHLTEGYLMDGVEANALKTAGEKLRALVEKLAHDEHPSKPIVTAVREGTIYKEILDYAERHENDLIIMASHRPELRDYLIGPNAARVVRHSMCSVMVVR